MTKKIFRKDLLIENIRKTLLNDDDSCYWCPIKDKCNPAAFSFDKLFCDDERADDFTQAIIDKFSTDVEVVDNETD